MLPSLLAGETIRSANGVAMPDFVSILLAVLFAVCASTIGDLFLAVGMRKVGVVTWRGLAAVPGQIWQVVRTPQIPIAVLFMAVFFFTWLALLSWADLSFILPLTALTYVLNGLAARPCLGEHVSLQRWMGILVITLGVVLVSITGTGE